MLVQSHVQAAKKREANLSEETRKKRSVKRRKAALKQTRNANGGFA